MGKYLKFALLKITEITAIIFGPFLFGHWAHSWPSWMTSIWHPQDLVLKPIHYWVDGLETILLWCVGIPVVIALGVFIILGFIYWNLKWAGFKPVWLWTVEED